MTRRSLSSIAALALVGALALQPVANAAIGVDSSELRADLSAAGIMEHLQAFQAIADANGGTRHAASTGYTQSADYVESVLEAAGYSVTRTVFDFPFFQEFSDPTLTLNSPAPPAPKSYVLGTEFQSMEYSGSGTVTGSIVPTNDVVIPPGPAGSSTSGCDAADYPAAVAGEVALIQRGTCTFGEKAVAAQIAGAAAAIIFNEGQAGRTDVINGTLGGPVTIPVLDTSFAVGQELYNLARAGGAEVTITTDTLSETRQSENVVANTSGRTDRVVVVGAHLDSVPEGPGIQDNGTGSAALLELATLMADLEPRNQVRFAWWGAEEAGLLGSEHYVSQLSKRDVKDIALNLNFDMIASPNFVRFVYDGDGSDTPTAGPNGSKVIEDVFLEYFGAQGLATEPTAFDGRSDYGPFIAVGIPAGGLFTGAEVLKTAEQVPVYGGSAGIAYDPCYHQACDTVANVNTVALEQMSDAAAHSVLTFAMTTSAVNGTSKSSNSSVTNLEFKGSHRQR
ncbi:MAG: M28 family peptidase [Actinomycetota bacterium]